MLGLEDILNIVFHVIIAVVPFIVGGMLIHLAFGGKKENKKKNEKLFETTAFLHTLDAARNAQPRKFR